MISRDTSIFSPLRTRTYTTTQEGFHPMRGHVDKGVTVCMRDHSMLVVLPDGMRGWKLIREDGSVYADGLQSAGAVLGAIVDY